MDLKTIIIDDESKLREVLSIKLKKYCSQVKLVGMAASAEEGYALIKELKPDLVFLDIAMPGESGFQLLSRFELIDFEIIFATGFNEYALDALKVSAVDYLLKPVKTDELISSVERAEKRILDKKQLQNIQLLKYNIKHIGDQESKIVIPGTDSYRFVEVKEIIRCEGWQKYTKIYLTDNSCLVSSYNIGTYKDMLVSYGFYSCHKSHLINIKHIVSYNKEGIVVLIDKVNVPVSRRKREEFISLFIKKK